MAEAIRKQFTKHDEEIFPEYNNSEYLEYEKVSTGLSTELCSHGFSHNGKWIKKEDICVYCREYKWENKEKHIAEIAKFLQEEIRKIQDLLTIRGDV